MLKAYMMVASSIWCSCSAYGAQSCEFQLVIS